MPTHVQQAMRSTSSADLLVWWQTLTGDEQDLLRVTHSVIPDDPHLMGFLAWTECPLVDVPADAESAYRLDRPDQLHAFFAQM